MLRSESATTAAAAAKFAKQETGSFLFKLELSERKSLLAVDFRDLDFLR